MKPSVYAICCVKDRWFWVAPAEHDFRARTYERMEMRAVDSGKLDNTRPAMNDNDDRSHPHHQA